MNKTVQMLNKLKDIEHEIHLEKFSGFLYNRHLLLDLISDQINYNEEISITTDVEELKLQSEKNLNNLLLRVYFLASLINQKIQRPNNNCGSFYADIRPCSEDCSFCPLSKDHYESIDIHQFQWKDLPDAIFNYANQMVDLGIHHFKVVTTGAKSDHRIIPFIAEGMKRSKEKFPFLTLCISEGTLDKKSLTLLREAGVDIFNNNLETSRDRFSTIVTSHSYDDKITAIKTAKSLGYKICSGGLFGIGENLKERVELFLTLGELGVDSSPFNIFVQFPNLKLTKQLKEMGDSLSKNEVFYSIALFRLINPTTRLVLGAGRRDYFTEDEQRFALLIGATSLATSGYFSKEGLKYYSEMDKKLYE